MLITTWSVFCFVLFLKILLGIPRVFFKQIFTTVRDKNLLLFKGKEVRFPGNFLLTEKLLGPKAMLAKSKAGPTGRLDPLAPFKLGVAKPICGF